MTSTIPYMKAEELRRQIAEVIDSFQEASGFHVAVNCIGRALRENHWNQSKSARALGISRDNLRYRLKKYDIKRDAQ